MDLLISGSTLLMVTSSRAINDLRRPLTGPQKQLLAQTLTLRRPSLVSEGDQILLWMHYPLVDQKREDEVAFEHGLVFLRAGDDTTANNQEQ